MLLDKQGRNPFVLITPNSPGVGLGKSGKWLYTGSRICEIGDNTMYPSEALHVRSVNKKMANFIIRHFETIPSRNVLPVVLASLNESFTY
jgi:hypothetical protein